MGGRTEIRLYWMLRILRHCRCVGLEGSRLSKGQEMVSSHHRTTTILTGLLAAIAFLGIASNASSQACFDHIRNLNYSPTNCSAQPEIDRVFRLQTITWKDHKYLFVDEGNEIKIFNIDNPFNPTSVTTSFFSIPNVGDSDYDMVNFTVCDDCRYGMANYKAASVLFDLGTASTPSFVAEYKNFSANLIQGGFTFKYGVQQYVVAASLGSSPCANNKSGLYEFNGVDEAGNPLLECLDVSGSGTEIVNGLYLESANLPVLYMADRFDRFRIFQIQPSPTFGLDYVGNGGIDRANMARGYGAAADEAAGLMAVANAGGLFIYDIGHTSGSPASPILRSTTTLPALGNANAVAVKYPIVHVSQQYAADAPLTFDVSNPSSPVPLDQNFWDPSYPWNNLGACMWNNHAVFSLDGSALYLSRYSVLQVFDPAACQGSVPPQANLDLDPQPAFPGDLITVANTSVWGNEFATWITDGPDPHASTILAGTISFSSATTLPFVLPGDMEASSVVYAHAAVQQTGYPFVPGSTPDQIETRQIAIDRTPDVAISITPEGVIAGDAVNLTAVTEGHPAAPGGGDPFGWTITDPSGGQTAAAGNPVSAVPITESGQWIFDLAVKYQHDSPGQPGIPYIATTQVIRLISSVAAAFTASPSSPMHNETIILTSTSAAQTGATLDFDWDVLTPSGILVHELAFCDGPGAVNDACVIPAETLYPGTFDLRLTLTNTNNSDQSTAVVEDFQVFFSDPQTDFTWAPTSPEIGQWVGFNVTGVSAGDIERAVWTFGGTGCDGTTTYTCVEPSFPGCDVAAFAYNSGGTKTVRLDLTTTGGVVQPQVSHTLTVQNTGSCNPGCTYAISPVSRTFGPAGGAGTISVSTQTGCTWTAIEAVGWITINSGSSGSGTGTVSYTVAVNTGPTRSANITVAGKIHTVSQTTGIVCTYGLPVHSAVYDPSGGSGSYQVNTSDPSCPWLAGTAANWILITNGGNHTGSGPLTYTVAENDTPHQRTGFINITGTDGFADQFTIIQNHPWIPVNFEWDIFSPEIGETVTFTTDPRLEVLSWSFSSPDCQGNEPITTCSGIAGVCNEVEWTWAGSGPMDVTMVTTTGSQTKTVTVRNTGECPAACGGVGPDDGTVENGYGWGAGSSFVQRFTPEAYPFVVTHVCAAFTQASADTSLDFNVVVFADDGPGGGPGTIIGGATASVDDVPGWLDHTFATVAIDSPSLIIDQGSVYIGVEWNEATEIGFYVAADESPGTPVQTGFYREQWGPWFSISSTFSNYRSLLVRTDGYPISDGEWEMVVGSTVGGGNGFGDSDNIAATAIAGFGGALFVGTENLYGCEVNYSYDGIDWFLGGLAGFGHPANESISSLNPFVDGLYASTHNPVTGTETFRAEWGAGGTLSWALTIGPGAYDPFNVSAPSGAVFDGYLYLGTDHSAGCEIWRTPGVTPVGSVWTQVHLNGFGDPQNQIAESMAVFHGELYVGTLNSNGAELWRSPDGIVWFPVVTGGFGAAPTRAITDLAVFADALYAGASNPVTGVQIWRSTDGTVWELVVGDGFDDPGNTVFNALAIGDLGLYASISGPSKPGAIWHSENGTTWAPSSSPGFADPHNDAIGSLHSWNNRVFAGTANPSSGCEIWRGGRHTLFDDGFETGDTTGWTAVWP